VKILLLASCYQESSTSTGQHQLLQTNPQRVEPAARYRQQPHADNPTVTRWFNTSAFDPGRLMLIGLGVGLVEAIAGTMAGASLYQSVMAHEPSAAPAKP
jgi:hypothetical protein